MWTESRNSYRKKQVVCAILGICASLLLTMAVLNRQEVVMAKRYSDAQAEMADEVFRFHVLANSDCKEDQELKLKVRDAVLTYIREAISEKVNDSEQMHGFEKKNAKLQCVKSCIREQLDEIEQIAYATVCKEGYDYQVNAKVLECYFPDRRYGEVLFPKGYYEALRVEIGKASGHNWWCVLYPSLCFIDATCAAVTDEGEQELESVLSEESYKTVTASSGTFKIKSFFYELFKEKTAD